MPDLTTQITEAKTNGYSDAEIIGYLGSARADLAPKLKEAQTSGYEPGEILEFLRSQPPPARLVAPPPERVVLPGSRKDLGGGRYEYQEMTPPHGTLSPLLPPGLTRGGPAAAPPGPVDYAATAPAGGFPVALPPGLPSPPPPEFSTVNVYRDKATGKETATPVPAPGLDYLPPTQQYVTDIRTGEKRPVTPYGESALDFPYTAGKHFVDGAAALTEPLEAGARDQSQTLRARAEAARTGKFDIPVTTQTDAMRRSAARGATHLITGAFDAAQPLILASGVTAPVGTLMTLFAAGLSEEAVRRALKALDTPEEYSELAGAIAGVVGAHAGALFSYVKNAAFRRMVKSILQTRLNNQFRASEAKRRADRMTYEAQTSGARPVPEQLVAPVVETQPPPPAEPVPGQPELMPDGTRKWATGTHNGHTYPMQAKFMDGSDVTVMGPAYPDHEGGVDPDQLFVRRPNGESFLTTRRNIYRLALLGR